MQSHVTPTDMYNRYYSVLTTRKQNLFYPYALINISINSQFSKCPTLLESGAFPLSTNEADHIPFLAPQIVFVLAHDLFSVSSNDSGRVA